MVISSLRRASVNCSLSELRTGHFLCSDARHIAKRLIRNIQPLRLPIRKIILILRGELLFL